MKKELGCLILLGSVPLTSLAEAGRAGDARSTGPDSNLAIDRIVVIASRAELPAQPGSVQFLDAELLGRHAYADINRVLRQVPGLNIVEEDGQGLRPSIGIRGSGTDRNTKIAVHEDGVPIAPAPYAAPAAYYFPRTPRIHAVEVSKGPAAIKYGPQTVAGAIGLYSTPVPVATGMPPSGRAEVSAAEDNTWRGRALLGGHVDSALPFGAGWSIETLQEHSDGFKALDSGGNTGFRVHDYVAKLALYSNVGAARPQSLELKVQQSEEDSRETYLGLALTDFRNSPYRRYRASQLDRLGVDHHTMQLTHQVDLGAVFDLTTIMYHTRTERAWYKLNDVRNAADTGFTSLGQVLADPASFPVEYAALLGAPGTSSASDALRMRNNARDYFATGIQSVLGMHLVTGGLDHELELSLRHHRDEEDRFQNDDCYQMVDGRMQLTSMGVPGTQDNRLGEAQAWSAYLLDTISTGNWTFAPGVRYERIELERTNWGTTDPGRAGSGTVARNTIDTLLPGLGLSHAISQELTLVAGLHRGFVNPAPGSTAHEEKSWNYEAGLRWSRATARVEAIGFYVDYENLLGTCTASTGGDCTVGDQFDGGAARVHGVELTAAWDAGAVLGTGIAIPLNATYTWTHGEFRSSFTSNFEEWGTVEDGDELPLVPAHQLTLGIGLEGVRWRTYLTFNHVTEARSVAGQGSVSAEERVDARSLVDIAGEYDLGKDITLFATVENLGDEIYNVGFRPAGARPGAPRTARAGFRLRW